MIPTLLPLSSFSSLLGKIILVPLTFFIVIGLIGSVLDMFNTKNLTLWTTLIFIVEPLVFLLMYFFGVYNVFGYVILIIVALAPLKYSIDHPLF